MDAWRLDAFTVLTLSHVLLMDVAVLILIKSDFGLTRLEGLHHFWIQMDCYSGACITLFSSDELIIRDLSLDI